MIWKIKSKRKKKERDNKTKLYRSFSLDNADRSGKIERTISNGRNHNKKKISVSIFYGFEFMS